MKKEDRATRWAKLLGLDPLSQGLLDIEQFAEHSKPPPHVQTRIQQDCLALQRRHHYFQEANLRNSMELLVSYYMHRERIPYVSGIQEVMAPFFLMGFQRFDSIYLSFAAFVRRMMPCVFRRESSVPTSCKLLHQLLLYHDPALCTSLDAKMITPQQYAETWFSTLFADSIDFMLLINFWELALKENNVSFPLFFALVLVQKYRDQLLTRKAPKEVIQITIEIDSIEELDPLCQEAIALQHQTPKSFIKFVEEALLHGREPAAVGSMMVMQVAQEDVQVARAGNFVIDLRSSADYMRGHYPCSYNLSKDLKMTTEELWNVLNGFATFYFSTTGRVCHFVMCGEDDQTAASTSHDLVRRGVERISVLRSGYTPYGQSHDSERCARCELNRDLLLSADNPGSLPRHKKVLVTMWHTFLHEEHSFAQSTPASSTASSPRAVPATHHHRISEELGGESTGRPTNTARSTEYDTSQMSLADCVKLMWTEGLKEAETYFEEHRTQEYRYSLHYTEAAFLRALLIGDKSSRTVALDRLTESESAAEADYRSLEAVGDPLLQSRTLTKAEATAALKSAQRVRMATAVYAETQLCRSGCHILHEAYIKGSLAFRTAWKLYQKCAKLTDAQRTWERTYFTPEEVKAAISPQIEDDINSLQKFGLGVLSLSLSMAPQKVVRLAKLAAGMEADQAQGLKHLYECIHISAGIRVPLALMFVIFWVMIYIPDFIEGKEDRQREAAELVKMGRALFPKSAFFYWLESYLKEKSGQLNNALILLEKATRVCTGLGFVQTPPRIAFEKGWVYFLCQNWPQSVHHLEQSLQGADPTPFSYLLLGISCCMLGHGQAAEQWFHRLQAPEMERGSTERWIAQKAKRFLTRKCYPLFPLEIIYLTDYLGCMAQDWHENALKFLESLQLDVPKLPQARSFFSLTRPIEEESDEYVIYLLLKGSVHRHLGHLRAAVTSLELAVQYQDSAQKEAFAVPHALYELGMVYVRGRDWQAAGLQLTKAKGFKRYEFRKSLMFKIDAAMELVAKEEKKEARR